MRFDTPSKVALILLLLQFFTTERIYISALMKFKTLKCEVFDKTRGEFEACKVKAMNKNTNRISLAYKLKRDSDNCILNVQLMKKESGWRPFLYNITGDACAFLRNRKKHFLANMVYKVGEKYTNVNHTCPYLKGEVLKLDMGVPNETAILERFPVGVGEYGLFSNWYVDNKLTVSIRGSGVYSDYRQV